MFTGIVQQIGVIVKSSLKGSLLELSVKIPALNQPVKIGDSIAVNGVCLTVTTKSKEPVATRVNASKPYAPSSMLLTFDVMPETAGRTTLKTLKTGDKVNTELAILSGQPFGGHFVLGHIDAVGKISAITKSSGQYLIKINCPSETAQLMIEKGSVAVDGVSLTSFDIKTSSFTTALIPHTLKNTVLGKKKAGDSVNLEADMMGKYIKKLLPGKKNSGFNADEGF